MKVYRDTDRANLEMKATRASVLCTNCSVLEFWTTSPFRRHRIPSLCGSTYTVDNNYLETKAEDITLKDLENTYFT